MNKIVLLLPYLLVSLSCTKENDNQSIVKTISLTENIEETILFEDIVIIDSIKTIKENDFMPFGSVKNYFPLSDERFLLHTGYPNTLSLLDSELSIVNQIVPEASNPFAINQINSVCVFDNEIYTLERDGFTVSVFNYDFKLLRKIDVPFFCQSIKILEKGILALYIGNEPTENSKGKFVIYDYINNLIISDQIPISENQRKYFNFLTPYHFDESQGDILFWDSSINRIFKVENNEIIDLYKLDYGRFGVPNNFYETNTFDGSFDFVMQMRESDYAFRHFKIESNDETIFITFEMGGKYYHSIFNITNQNVVTFNGLKHKGLADLKISENDTEFFVSFYGKNKTVCFLPYEFVEKQSKQIINNTPVYQMALKNKESMLIFCTIK